TGAFADGNLGMTTPVGGLNMDGAINGPTTSVDGAAYTNNIANNGALTTLYTLDAATNSLYIQTPPNSGTQTAAVAVTLGGAPLDFTNVGGFDIGTGVNVAVNNAAAQGSAFAVLTVGGATSLYSIDLATGAATRVGALGDGLASVDGFAVHNEAVAGGAPVVALNSLGTQLLRFNSATPGAVTTVNLPAAGMMGGVAMGEVLVGIDFRPSTGQLVGLAVNEAADTATLYRIDPQTGTLTAIGAVGSVTFAGVDLPAAAVGYGVDFNPAVDLFRVVTGSGLNFRVNPNTGLPASATPDAMISGLPMGSAGVSATAYTGSFAGTTATTQYTLDADSNSLFIQGAVAPPGPNGGVQSGQRPITLNGTPLDFTAVSGFDIGPGVTSPSANAAAAGRGFAVLTVGGVASLYSIDLATGAATLLGAVGPAGTLVGGLAIGQAPAGVVSIPVDAITVSESAGVVNGILTRTGGSSGTIVVTLFATPGGTATVGDDFTVPTTTVTFLDGQTTATFTILITNDTAFESTESVVGAVTTTGGGSAIGRFSQATVTITDDDPPP
ncbi:MAG: DUF4394 domain-containing protein, partial [Planctomycetia bacterium]